MGTSGRLPPVTKSSLDVPGPGNYSTSTVESSPRFGFGSSKRGNLGNKSIAPGPGAYPLKGVTGFEGRQQSMHARLEAGSVMSAKVLSPGPGNYNLTFAHKTKMPAFGLGTSKRPSMLAGGRH